MPLLALLDLLLNLLMSYDSSDSMTAFYPLLIAPLSQC